MKKIILLLTFLVVFSLVPACNIFDLPRFVGQPSPLRTSPLQTASPTSAEAADSDPSEDSALTEQTSSPPATQAGTPLVSGSASTTEKGYWELIDTEEIIPETYRVGDDRASLEYSFEYSNGRISCTNERLVYVATNKPYDNELIVTTGEWSQPSDDGAYLPDEKVKLILKACIDEFKRLTPPESGGNGTNYTGVSVWAYIGDPERNIALATQSSFKDSEGKINCNASIVDGKIAVQSKTLEVAGTFGPGRPGARKALFVAVSNQGRIGGIKYIYEYQ